MNPFFNPNELFVIAEAGVNHNGRIDLAMQMIDAAKTSGANAVKFQTWITEQVYNPEESVKPDYQKQGTDPRESEYDTVKKLELSFDSFRKLKAYCDKVGIMMLSTPDENQSADFLIDDLQLPAIKVASQDLNNRPFLRYLAQRHKPMILSTGASTMAEVSVAVEWILSAGCPSLAVLHCTTCYPAPMTALNLRVISTFREVFGLPIGYSDHTLGHAAGCAAVALGACILEKHFTLSRKLPGPDQEASLEPQELRDYVQMMREVKAALGTGEKIVAPEEASNRLAIRRYLAAAHPLPAGHTLQSQDIALMKISYGLSPDHFDMVVGAKVRNAIKAGTRIQLKDLEFAPQAGFTPQQKGHKPS